MNKNYLRITTGIAFWLATFSVYAAEHSEGAERSEGGIPREVFWQVANFVAFALILYFLLRKKIVHYYREREESFRQALLRAESTRREAEQQKREIQERLAKLENGLEQTMQQARLEAEALRRKILVEAKGLSAHLQEEAERSANYEIERAKAELREDLIAQSVNAAKTILNEKMQEPDQKRLQNEFVENLQVVRQ